MSHSVPSRPPLAALALVCNAFIWGCSWYPFRALEGFGLHPLWTTVCVHSFSLIVIGCWRPSAFAAVARAPALWVLALAAGTTNAAFNWGVVAGDVVRVVLLFYLMPLWAVLLARWLLKEPLTVSAGLRVLLALAGAVVVLWPADGGWPVPRSLPDLLGLVGGMGFALNNVMLRREAARPEVHRSLAMFIGGVSVSAVLATVFATVGAVAWPPAPSAAWVMLAAGMGTLFLVSNVALQYGAARLPTHVTSVVMLSEVLFASVSAVWLGSGALSAQLAAGGACIVAAALLAAFSRA